MNRLVTSAELENLSEEIRQRIRKVWVPKKGQRVYDFEKREMGNIVSGISAGSFDFCFTVESLLGSLTWLVWKSKSLPIILIGEINKYIEI